MSIELRIDRLVIDEAVLGGERVDQVRAAIERELGRSLAGPGVAERLREIGAVATLPGVQRFAASPPGAPAGARISSAVLQGLGLPMGARHGSATQHG